MDYKKITLNNKLRVLFVPDPNAYSVTATVMVGVGSRHEDKKYAGIAHFIEHNVFKGTQKRPRRNEITEEIEALGGITNAATGHEYTYYWIKAVSEKAEKILDIVLDISLNMTFPEADLEIERGNIIEEINMYQDNPMYRIMDEFLEFVWDGHPVGAQIAGTKESVSGITKESMTDFVQSYYTPDSIIVVVSGKFDQDRALQQVKDYYGNRTVNHQPNKLDLFTGVQSVPRVYLDKDKTQQAHFCLGFKTFGRTDERRFSLDVLNTVLGRGMSSRLFRKLRNELGLAYYVGSTNWELEETGTWFVRAGVDNKRIIEALEVVISELKDFANTEVGKEELTKAKEYMKGKTLLGVETSDELGNWYGFQELSEPEVLSPIEYNRRVDAVTTEDVRRTAQELLRNSQLNLAVVGPFDDRKIFEQILNVEK
jgi:predicted Zn-dependent peptidase